MASHERIEPTTTEVSTDTSRLPTPSRSDEMTQRRTLASYRESELSDLYTAAAEDTRIAEEDIDEYSKQLMDQT